MSGILTSKPLEERRNFGYEERQSIIISYLSKEYERFSFILAAQTRLGCSLRYNEPESSAHHHFAFSPSQIPQAVATVIQDRTTRIPNSTQAM